MSKYITKDYPSNQCYECGYRKNVPGSAHSICTYNWGFTDFKYPKAVAHGFNSGWYYFPINFDPVWQTSVCPVKSKVADPIMISSEGARLKILTTFLNEHRK